MANLKLSIQYKDEYVDTILSAMATLANKKIYLSSEIEGRKFEFIYPEKGSDNDKVWGEKFIASFVTSFTKLSLLYTDDVRYNSEISSIDPPTHSIVEDIIEIGD